jgi:hypothetical protein
VPIRYNEKGPSLFPVAERTIRHFAATLATLLPPFHEPPSARKASFSFSSFVLVLVLRPGPRTVAGQIVSRTKDEDEDEDEWVGAGDGSWKGGRSGSASHIESPLWLRGHPSFPSSPTAPVDASKAATPQTPPPQSKTLARLLGAFRDFGQVDGREWHESGAQARTLQTLARARKPLSAPNRSSALRRESPMPLGVAPQ